MRGGLTAPGEDTWTTWTSLRTHWDGLDITCRVANVGQHTNVTTGALATGVPGELRVGCCFH